MRAFSTDTDSPAAFASRVTEALRGRGLGSIVSVEGRPDAFFVRFDRLGKSEVEYRVSPNGGGFRAEVARESIAFAHRAFRSDIEGRLDEVIVKLGAKAG